MIERFMQHLVQIYNMTDVPYQQQMFGIERTIGLFWYLSEQMRQECIKRGDAQALAQVISNESFFDELIMKNFSQTTLRRA